MLLAQLLASANGDKEVDDMLPVIKPTIKPMIDLSGGASANRDKDGLLVAPKPPKNNPDGVDVQKPTI